jgi:citrate lyase synthetase
MIISPSLELQLREFKLEDASIVSGIICRCLREVNSKDYPSKTIEHMCQTFSPENLPNWFSGMDTVILMTEGQNILGTGSLKENRIMTVFISPDQQGKRIGSRIMDHLETLASQRGHRSLVLNSSLSSLNFYKNRNYLEKSRMHEEMGGEMIAMEKAI